ncbi:MAG: hypothetical protein ABIH41_02955 [Nanoarchaeota archaeon]
MRDQSDVSKRTIVVLVVLVTVLTILGSLSVLKTLEDFKQTQSRSMTEEGSAQQVGHVSIRVIDETEGTDTATGRVLLYVGD